MAPMKHFGSFSLQCVCGGLQARCRDARVARWIAWTVHRRVQPPRGLCAEPQRRHRSSRISALPRVGRGHEAVPSEMKEQALSGGASRYFQMNRMSVGPS
jgi:hypothetical protein